MNVCIRLSYSDFEVTNVEHDVIDFCCSNVICSCDSFNCISLVRTEEKKLEKKECNHAEKRDDSIILSLFYTDVLLLSILSSFFKIV